MWPSSPAAPVGAPVDPSSEDQPATDAGADGEHDQVLHQRRASVVEGLVQRRHGGVVVHEDRQSEPLLEHSAKVQVREVEIDARADATGRELDHRRHADPDADGAGAPCGIDRGDHLTEQVLRALASSRPEHGLLRRSFSSVATETFVPPTSTPISWPLNTLVNGGGEGSSAEPAACRAR